MATNNNTRDEAGRQMGETGMEPCKTVSYSYPNSPESKRLGFPHLGIWKVVAQGYEQQLFTDANDRRAAIEAFAYADSIPLPYSRLSFVPLRENPNRMILPGEYPLFA